MEIGDWITLSAVLVALGLGVVSIIQTQWLQKRERKERLLNEIIEWATEISKPLSTKIFDDLAREAGNKAKIQLYINAHIAQILGDISKSLCRNVYIKKISLSFDNNVRISVDNLIDEINRYMEFLKDWHKKSAKEILEKKEIDQDDFSKAGIFETNVKRYAINVIEIVAKTKTNNI